MAIPAHPMATLYCATKGFCVLDIDTNGAGGASEPAPHPAIKLHVIDNAIKTRPFTANSFSIFSRLGLRSQNEHTPTLPLAF